jgi:peptidoglycan/xylan/chitin deacetylase (PgdA/CDA1 family)
LRKHALVGCAREASRGRDGVDPTRRVVVLGYHSIHPRKSFASATPVTFGHHLDWLAATCDVIPLEQIPEAALTSCRARPAGAITFDDGYLDNYEFAFPLLQSRHLPATFFVTAGLLEKDPAVLARARTLRRTTYDGVRPLEWTHVTAMHTAGMQIGAHTYSYPNLAALDRQKARDELLRSKQIIEERLGERIRSMAYPFGKPGRHYTAETATLVEEVGYDYACAALFRAVRSSDSRFAIPRLGDTQHTAEGLRDKALGEWDMIGMWEERCPLWPAGVVPPDDFGECA